MTFTTQTAALYLGISQSRLDNLCQKLQIEYTRDPKTRTKDRVFEQTELDRWDQERRQRPRGGRPKKEQVMPVLAEAELKRRYRRITKAFNELDAQRSKTALQSTHTA